MIPQKKFSVFGIIGCLCFGVGDWLLGVVDPEKVDGDVFYFIRAGHGAAYETWKLVVVLALAVFGMCFLYPGFVHIADIARDNKTKKVLEYVFALCLAGWLVIHFIVAVNVFIFSQAERNSGYESAVILSGSFGSIGMAALGGAYLFVAAALLKLVVDILRQKTCLKRTAAFFTPVIPITVIFIISQILPSSPFLYGLYTFCMNGGMLIWFLYLLRKQ